jgi:hypothetical protein
MTKTFKDKTLFGYSNFGHWDSFDILDLKFGISVSLLTINKADSLWGFFKFRAPDIWRINN